MSDKWFKDPDETLDFRFDWAPLVNGTGDSNWLDQTTSPVEMISSQTTTADTGLTVDNSGITNNNTTVTVILSGGTAGNKYKVTNRITTSNSQVAERTAIVYIADR